MRAAPPVLVQVTRFGLWQAAVWIAAGLGVLVALVWSFGHLSTRGWWESRWVVFAAGLAGVAALRLAAQLGEVRAFELRWDGRAWHLARPAAPAADPIVGDVQVAVDLGNWLLVRFTSDWPPEESRRYWLPLQRWGGAEAAWHGLRCALYSPRQMADVPDPDAAQ